MKKKKIKKKNLNKKMLFVELAVVIVLVAIAAFFIIGGLKKLDPLAATDYVQIDVADYGTITAELYGNTAPITVKNFLKLADEGFYDGLTFHRIISGFMIQGGAPQGNSFDGTIETIKGEFMLNGVQNEISHERGVLSMARSMMYDSASTQFFVMHANSSHLDGRYAAFGRVLEGIEVVDAICAQTPVINNNGGVASENQPVIASVRRIKKP